MLLLVTAALCAPHLGPVGSPVPLSFDRSGNWPRALPAEVGWDFFFASGGDYWHATLDDALVPDPASLRPLTGRSDLVDHAVTRCPDGSVLHTGSYTTDREDDSVAAFRYDADFALVEEVTVVEGGRESITRDMPVVCGETFTGLGVFDAADGQTFAALSDGGVAGEVELEDAPMTTGSAWLEEDGTLWAIGHAMQGGTGELQLRGYDDAFALRVADRIRVVPEPLSAYWSQGLVHVGDYWVVAFMVRDESAGWQLQDGDVWLAVFDPEWSLVETVQVTAYPPPVGAMQPGLAWKDGRLLVTWVSDLALFGAEVPFEAEEAEEADEAEEEPVVGGGVGCAHGAAGIFAPGLLLGACRRRRRT